jgi:tRNA pseudouridine38-40 synthase
MAHYKLILAYDGALFAGYQRQGRKVPERRTVQGVVEAALRKLGWQANAIQAAGRTDTGTHAAGQVIAFDLDWRHSLQDLQTALNASLPPDVAVRSVEVVADGFHPRYDAHSRRYRYTLFCDELRDPLKERYAWRVWPAVELKRLESAASPLVGEHDFKAFGSPPRGTGSTVRRVQRVGWQSQNDYLVFEIVADAFLYRMVRRLVYAQVLLAQDRLPLDAIEARLNGEIREMVQGLAPAHGLVLAEVLFE